MIIDLNNINSDPFREKMFDVCICGAGVAGITLALKLSPRLNVVLLEAGGYEVSENSQNVYKGTNVGREYFNLNTTRLRYFGGTSNHWSGWCRPLDSYDFSPKPYAQYTGWPIKQNDLEPYLEEAKSILDIPIQRENIKSNAFDHMQDLINKSQDFKSIEFWLSAPTRFGKKYKAELERRTNITCYLNANVTDISLYESFPRVRALEFCDYSGRVFKIHAQIIILAAGGIENPRILLNSNYQIKEGLGNKGDLVGRFFNEHPHYIVGGVILEDVVKENFKKKWILKDPRYFRFFSPKYNFMQRNKILNCGIHYEPFNPNRTRRSNFKDRLRAIVCDSDLAMGAINKIRGKEVVCKTIWDGFLTLSSEQMPNPSSRISLGSDLDRFGNRRIILDWRLSEIDKRTVQLTAIRFGITLASLGLGRVRLFDWVISRDEKLKLRSYDMGGVAANHHMCTTRMDNSSHNGVVDSNQRVFDIDNLYIAGSSVFSTGGHANPTLTIVQMSLRLSEHLNNTFKNRL